MIDSPVYMQKHRLWLLLPSLNFLVGIFFKLAGVKRFRRSSKLALQYLTPLKNIQHNETFLRYTGFSCGTPRITQECSAGANNSAKYESFNLYTSKISYANLYIYIFIYIYTVNVKKVVISKYI